MPTRARILGVKKLKKQSCSYDPSQYTKALTGSFVP